MVQPKSINRVLGDIRYEIRGQLAQRALELERRGYAITSLNIGNPGLFGFRAGNDASCGDRKSRSGGAVLPPKNNISGTGSSFNTQYEDHFRITTLPDCDTLHQVFDRIDALLEQHA